ncbi:hypothetical protein B4589_007410 [Halolamina sp. CBA1230]|uniref:hypothetical protein n=1 Tax=Halolamina sp. CBA1230 TaxID=1853690 RepID=UPI0009A1521E|nr:hypothetical protein [Halolamina sp. CBA1230]QKY20212.1 hypothetical protein B4589_007410 [Halolamina sp. CBA1230]
MEVRDAVERDAAAMAAMTDAPEPVLRNVIHERSVRVLAEEDGTADDDPDDESALRGFVSFDAREDAVFVTQFGGDREACERLLAEPLRFARAEGLPVEVVLRDDDDAMRSAAESVGFEAAGAGPRFRGEPTRTYRHEG